VPRVLGGRELSCPMSPSIALKGVEKPSLEYTLKKPRIIAQVMRGSTLTCSPPMAWRGFMFDLPSSNYMTRFFMNRAGTRRSDRGVDCQCGLLLSCNHHALGYHSCWRQRDDGRGDGHHGLRFRFCSRDEYSSDGSAVAAAAVAAAAAERRCILGGDVPRVSGGCRSRSDVAPASPAQQHCNRGW